MTYLLPKKGCRVFYSVLGESENSYDELHGAYETRPEAIQKSRELYREYSDYHGLTVVKVTVTQ